MTTTSADKPDDRNGPDGASPPSHELACRERDLLIKEQQVALREVKALQSVIRSGDLLEANEHLVMATLAAKQMEEAATATKRQQDEFLAMLAHELRNPLAPIRSAVALLERLDTIDSRLKLIHEVVRRQVDHMARLLDDLLDASRVTSGKVTLQRRPTDVHEFVNQAVETCRVLIDAQHQQLTLNMPVVPMYVDGDPIRLAQIFGNLLHNAAKYTPDGGSIVLSVRLDGGNVVISVADNGNGIAAESLTTIFDLFSQEKQSLSRSQGGLGIGLTVVRTMVEQHGGTVSVHSDGIGTGSDFMVVLPRINHLPHVVVAPAPVTVTSSLRILLIDDNVDAGVLLSMLLKIEGHEVQVALDGPSGLTNYQSHRPQLVLCDIGLPGMNGYEVAKRIRRDAEGLVPQPVLIALTGYDSAADRAMAASAGFNHHVAKPVDFEVLLTVMRRPS